MFTDECIEAGEQTRTNSICRDGIAVNVHEVQACERDTDGTIVVQPEFGECTYTDACIETGEQARTNSVCRNGTAVDEADVQVCVRDTDGTVLEHGEFEACRGFEDLCDLVGEQSRINAVCRAGLVTEEPEIQVCERIDPGLVVEANRATVCMTQVGGSIELPEGRIVVPPDALAGPTELFLERMDEVPLALTGLSVFGPVLNAGPSDTEFSRPITVSARFEGDRDRAALFVEMDPDYQRLGGRLVADAVEGEIEELGTFLVADGVDFRLNTDPTCVQLRTLDGRVQDPGTVALFFTADDCAGRPLTDLEPGDFEIAEGANLLNDDVARRLLPEDGVQTFVNLVIDLSDTTQDHLDQVIAGASSLVSLLMEDQNGAVQVALRSSQETEH